VVAVPIGIIALLVVFGVIDSPVDTLRRADRIAGPADVAAADGSVLDYGGAIQSSAYYCGYTTDQMSELLMAFGNEVESKYPNAEFPRMRAINLIIMMGRIRKIDCVDVLVEVIAKIKEDSPE